MPTRPARRLAVLFPLLAALVPAIAGAGGLARNPSGVAQLPAEAWQDAKRGVVVVSTAAAGPCVAGGLWMHVIEGRTGKPATDVPFVPVDLLERSEFDGHYGALSALSLPPGAYALSVSYASTFFDTTQSPAFVFVVSAGEVTYLGTVRKHGGCDSASPTFDVVDRHTPDLEAAAALARDPKGPARAVTRLMEAL